MDLSAHLSGNLVNSSYKYINQIKGLNICQAGKDVRRWPGCTPQSPLNVEKWALALKPHPNKEFTSYILSGSSESFRVGFNPQSICFSAVKNLHIDHPEVVSEYLGREVSLGRMQMSKSNPASLGIQVSTLGLIPKKHKQTNGD